MRSVTPRIRWRGTIGSAFSSRARLVSSAVFSPAAFWIVRPTISASSCPLVVIRPTREPVRVSSAFVAAVVPSVNRSLEATSSSSVDPSAAAALATESITPAEKSRGVDGALPTVTRPCSSSTTQSVKVPPLSTAITVPWPALTTR